MLSSPLDRVESILSRTFHGCDACCSIARNTLIGTGSPAAAPVVLSNYHCEDVVDVYNYLGHFFHPRVCRKCCR